MRTRAHLGAVEPVDGCLVRGGHLAVSGVDGDAGLLLDGGEALTTNQRLVFTMIYGYMDQSDGSIHDMDQ